jgi:predicted metal-dependent hydrolase
MTNWHRGILRAELAPLIRKWEEILGVTVSAFFVQKLKTKWGTCTPHKGYVRFNMDLVKKPKDLLEYVVVHELCHLLEPKHSERFYDLLSQHYPHWKEARANLNEMPVG